MNNSNVINKPYVQFSRETCTKIKKDLELSKELIDVKLCKFYFDVIKMILSKYVNKKMRRRKSLRGFLFKLRSETNAWCTFKDNSAQDTSFMYRLAYIFRNGTCLTSAVVHYFRDILVQNMDILETLLNQGEIKVCALGGGSAAEVVAIVNTLQVISNAAELNPDIFVTVVDVGMQWESTCIDILQSMDYFRDFPERIQFLAVDSLNCLDNGTENAIAEADIVTMVQILSEGERKLGWLKLERAVQNISHFIRTDSMLFVLDHPQAAVANACGGLFGILPNFRLICEETYGVHTLNASAVQLHAILHRENFGGILCNTYMNVFVRMWLKLSQPPPFMNYPSCCQNIFEAVKRLEDKKDYFLECKGEYTAARASEKISFKRWKATLTENMLKAGRTQKEINSAVSTWKDNGKKKVSACKDVMESAFREFMEDVDTICDFKNQHPSEQDMLWILYKYKCKHWCVARRDKHMHSVLDALISLKENQTDLEKYM